MKSIVILLFLVFVFTKITNGQELFVNFQPFEDSDCKGTSVGVGYSFQASQCLSFPGSVLSYYFVVDALRAGIKIFPEIWDQNEPICQGNWTFESYKNGTCIPNLSLDSNLDITTPYSLISISKEPLLPISGSVVNAFYNQTLVGSDDCATDSLVMLEYISNGTKSDFGGRQVTFYCNTQNEAVGVLCSDGSDPWGGSSCDTMIIDTQCQQSRQDSLYSQDTYCQ
ncbi:hypothetical protein DLAC_08844 [Tieghemostelium lacteum]|uniref:Uncharacterized protein n=1 Tax=Tieghemostelium lacteum TaxID=361077 RepID=A0A151Z8G6_TIELA|nr:hypothetical protein DLAC_08844 [Tieghemostelium lacteum]|eukprot:KYQ90242.1 hypothetical protein DLAC_08844 [Tieghemostelium lacteum]